MSWFTNDWLVKDQNDRLTKHNDWLQERVETLTTQILEMKQQGFVHEPTILRAPSEPSLPEVVESAISRRAPSGSTLYGDLAEYAQVMLGNGVDQEHLADNILTGAEDA